MPHSPLERSGSIKTKFGTVIVVAVAVCIFVMYVTVGFTVTLNEPGHVLAGLVGDTMALLRRLWWQLLVAGAVAGLIALGFARLLALGMTKPLRDMAEAARRMSRGDYDAHIETRSRDEVGRLADAFNSMAAGMREVEQLRRDLVTNVSHELKTPIAALRARLENILDGVEQADADTIGIMLAQCDRLGGMIEQLLDLSRLEAGDLKPEIERVGMAATAQAVVSEVQAARRIGDIDMEIDIPIDETIMVDPRLFHHLLFNLVDNAARITPPGGRIVIAARLVGQSWELSVTDTGPGIPEEDLTRVFERFYRVDRSRSRSGGGTGIGLAVARSIIEAHGGQIWAANSSEGGAIFTVRLPATQSLQEVT